MTSRRRSIAVITALTCGATLLTGAASAASATDDPAGEGALAGRTAQQISDTARHELLAATSLRLRTESTVDPTRMDLTLDRAGNCTGSVTKGPLGRVDLVKRGDQVWLKPDDAFWKSHLPERESEALSARIKGRYLHGTTADAFLGQLSAACDLATFQQQTAGPDKPPAGSPTPVKGEPTVHEGTRVLPITKERDGASQTLYVAIEGKHYPRKLTAEADHQSSSILMSDFNAPVRVQTPSADETVEIDALDGQLGDA